MLTTGILKARNIAYEEIEDDREILEHEGEEYPLEDMTRDTIDKLTKTK